MRGNLTVWLNDLLVCLWQFGWLRAVFVLPVASQPLAGGLHCVCANRSSSPQANRHSLGYCTSVCWPAPFCSYGYTIGCHAASFLLVF